MAFITVFGRQWIHRYTRGTTWANIFDRGKAHQVKSTGLHKWGLYLILESLPVLLQFSLLLSGAALVVYLWDLDVTVAQVVLAVISVGVLLYSSIAAAAAISCGYPFQTPLSVLLSNFSSWAKKSAVLSRVRLGHRLRERTTPLRVKWFTEHGYPTNSLGCVFGILAGGTISPAPPDGDTQRRLPNDPFQPRILEERSTFYFPHTEGYCRLCGVLVTGELCRFFDYLRCHRCILRVPIASLPLSCGCTNPTS